MHPLLVMAIPVALIILGMILNSIGLSFDQPPSSSEPDPVKRSNADGEAFRKFFDGQRRRAITRQSRVKQYGWLLIVATIGSFIWVYLDTTNKAVQSNRVAALQTLGSQEGKDMVLSLTLIDGSNVKYLIKSSSADKSAAPLKEPATIEKVSTWELEQLRTAMSLGDNPLPLGIALKMAN